MKKVLPWLLTLLLLAQLIPVSALAGEYTGEWKGVAVYRVTFGDGAPALLLRPGEALGALPAAPEKEGQTFTGWYFGDTLLTADYVPSGDVAAEARYESVQAQTAQQQLTLTAEDGITITVSGALPVGAQLTLTPNDEPTPQPLKQAAAAGEDAADETVNLYSYDIAIRQEDGSEFQPDESPVKLTVSGAKFGQALSQGRSIRVAHHLDDGSVEIIEDLQVSGSTVSFTVNHFSVFDFDAVWDLVDWFYEKLFNLTERVITTALGNLDITLSGRMPRNATANAVEQAPQIEGVTTLCAADITLLNAGNQVQPSSWNGAIAVTMTSEDIARAVADGQEIAVYHIADDGTQTRLDDSLVTVSGSAVSFSAEAFSVYAVVTPGSTEPEARATVNFYGKDQTTPLTTVYVKNSDSLEDLAVIVYDPGVGVVDTDDLFKGWTWETPDYDENTQAYTIEGVREYLAGLTIAEGDVINIYGMIFKTYSIIYIDEDNSAIKGDAIIFKSGTQPQYEVNMTYTPRNQDDKFLGWYVFNDSQYGSSEDHVSPIQPYYENETNVTLSGNALFAVNVSSGHWLSFIENGKGASYTPPQFVENTAVTVRPPDPTRKGYRFDGWYTGAPAETGGTPTGSEFVFGTRITERVKLYAKWTPERTADYMIIIWKQNVSGGDNYDFEEAVTVHNAAVGTVIDTVSRQGTGNASYARVNGVNKRYTGFYLDEFDQNVTIVPEGSSVVNVYYDRIEYTVRFYYARSQDTTQTVTEYQQVTLPNYNDGGTYYADANGRNRLTWNNNRRAWRYSGQNYTVGYKPVQSTQTVTNWAVATTVTGGNTDINPFTNATNWQPVDTGPTTSYPGGDKVVRNGNYDYHYVEITALYEQDIGSRWPDYEYFTNPSNNYRMISWWMMHGAHSYGGNGGGKNTVKGKINIMNEEILGNTTSSDGNFLIARYSNSAPTVYSYLIWKEQLEGEDYSGYRTTTRNGRKYYLFETLIANSNADPNGAHAPAYIGFDYLERVTHPISGGKANVDFYYTRQKFIINYMDGLYLNGNGYVLDNKTENQLKETGAIYYETDLDSYNKGGANYYEPDPEDGYVFAGWYADKACQHPYVFSTLPTNNITVYAKWVQKQYRVFLHPNVPTDDTSLTWAQQGQQMSFRGDYGAKISGGHMIVGERKEYELIGWYTDEACTKPFNFDAYVLNDTNVKTAYDQTEPTELDDYGNPTSDVNSDAENNRTWILSKLDLYAKWRSKLEGAKGIHVVYDANGGSNAPTDPVTYYLDSAEAIGQAASTPPDNTQQFLHWVVQRWDETAGAYVDTDKIVYPGGTYDVLKRDAHCVVQEYDEDGNIKTATYTVQLRAEYGPTESPTPTHITWYANGGERNAQLPQPSGVHYHAVNQVLTSTYAELQINEAAPIAPADMFTRENCKFMGWAKRLEPEDSYDETTDQVDESKYSPVPLTEDDLYLKYENGKYYAQITSGSDAWSEVEGVFGDEDGELDTLYAVWQSNRVEFTKNIEIAGELQPSQVDHDIYLMLWGFDINDWYRDQDGDIVYFVMNITDGVAHITDGDASPDNKVTFEGMPNGRWGVYEQKDATGTTESQLRAGDLFPQGSATPVFQLLKITGDNSATVADGSKAEVTLTNTYAKPDLPLTIHGYKKWMNRNAQEISAPEGAKVTYSLYKVVGSGSEVLVSGKDIVLDGTVDENMPATADERTAQKWYGEEAAWTAAWYGLDSIDPNTGESITYRFRETVTWPGYYPITQRSVNYKPMTDSQYKEDNGTIWNRDLTGTVVIQKHFDFQPHEGDQSVSYTAFGNDQDTRRILYFVLEGPDGYRDTFTLADTNEDGTPSVSPQGVAYQWEWDNNTQYKLYLYNMVPGTYTVTEYNQEHLLEGYNYYLSNISPATSSTGQLQLNINPDVPKCELTNIENDYRFGAVDQNDLKLKKTVTGLTQSQWENYQNDLKNIVFYIIRTVDGVKQYYLSSGDRHVDEKTGRMTKLYWTENINAAETFTVNDLSYNSSGNDHVSSDKSLNGWPKLEVGTYALEEKDESISGMEWTQSGGEFEIKPVYKNVNGSLLLDKFVSDPEVIPITNTYNLSNTNVTVAKTVVDESAAPLTGQTFSYTATLDSGKVFGDTQPDGVTLNGDKTQATFTLADGGSVALNVPIGSVLTVVEAENHNYSVKWLIDTGAETATATASYTVPAEDVETIRFTNTRKTADLTVSKTVSGNMGEQDKPFSFTVTVPGATVAVSAVKTNAAGTEEPVTLTPSGGVYSFTLMHGESMKLPGMPVNASVTAAEGSASPYTTYYKADSAAEAAGSSAAVTIAEAGNTVAFRNNNSQSVDTGVLLDNTPYLVIMSVAGLWLIALLLRKRRWRA